MCVHVHLRADLVGPVSYSYLSHVADVANCTLKIVSDAASYSKTLGTQQVASAIEYQALLMLLHHAGMSRAYD